MPDRPSFVNGWAEERDGLRKEEHLRIVEVVHKIPKLRLSISLSEGFDDLKDTGHQTGSILMSLSSASHFHRDTTKTQIA